MHVWLAAWSANRRRYYVGRLGDARILLQPKPHCQILQTTNDFMKLPNLPERRCDGRLAFSGEDTTCHETPPPLLQPDAPR